MAHTSSGRLSRCSGTGPGEVYPRLCGEEQDFHSQGQRRWRARHFLPSFEYFPADNLSLVARFEYSWLGVDLDNASLHLSEDLGLDITGEHYKRQSYALAAGVRYYLPFMGSKVFGFFVEGAVNGGYVHSMLYELEDGLKHGTYNSNWKVALRVDPGICFFVQENVDFEVSVGLLDLTYQFNKQSENQVKTSSGSGLGTGFNINLLALRFGVHFYLW